MGTATDPFVTAASSSVSAAPTPSATPPAHLDLRQLIKEPASAPSAETPPVGPSHTMPPLDGSLAAPPSVSSEATPPVSSAERPPVGPLHTLPPQGSFAAAPSTTQARIPMPKARPYRPFFSSQAFPGETPVQIGSNTTKQLEIDREPVATSPAVACNGTDTSKGDGGSGGAHNTEDEDSLCSVCMDAPSFILLAPCGHIVVCAKCCKEVRAADNLVSVMGGGLTSDRLVDRA